MIANRLRNCIDRPKSVRNRCVFEVFGGVFMLSHCVLDFSVSLGAFVMELSQIFPFLLFFPVSLLFSHLFLWKVFRISLGIRIPKARYCISFLFLLVKGDEHYAFLICLKGWSLFMSSDRMMESIIVDAFVKSVCFVLLLSTLTSAIAFEP